MWIVPLLVVLIAVDGVDNVPVPDAATFEPPDCGVNSLFVLFDLAGRPASLEAIARTLPTDRDPTGYSMEELSEASRRLGLPLRGRRSTRGEGPPARPAIAYLKTHRPGVGHFVAIRPVGVTGTMIQVVEPPNDPKVMDYADLLARNGGELRLLEPRKLMHTVVEYLWIVGLGLLSLIVLRALKARSRTPLGKARGVQVSTDQGCGSGRREP